MIPTIVMAAMALNLTHPPDEAAQSQPAAPATGFLFKTLAFNSDNFAYCLWVPPEYSADKAWPVILFLHGSGERGDDGLLQTDVGIGTAIRRNRHFGQALVVMPQCRRDHLWDGVMADMALKCVEQTSREYHLDPDRVYLTGLSLGGYGAWTMGARLSHQLAAVAPVCGFWGRPNVPLQTEAMQHELQNLAKLPIWAFHGKLDKSVPVERTRELVAAVKLAGGDVRYTEFADGEHAVWDRVYQDPEFWKWLLAQRRKPAATQPAP